MKMETATSSETLSILAHHYTASQLSEDLDLNLYRCDNLKAHTSSIFIGGD